jgi:beta-glucuronidase
MYAESDVPLIHNVMAYESSSLAGDWNYIVDVQEEGYYDYPVHPAACCPAFRTIII